MGMSERKKGIEDENGDIKNGRRITVVCVAQALTFTSQWKPRWGGSLKPLFCIECHSRQ